MKDYQVTIRPIKIESSSNNNALMEAIEIMLVGNFKLQVEEIKDILETTTIKHPNNKIHQSLSDIALYLEGIKHAQGDNILPLSNIDLGRLWEAINYFEEEV